MNFRPLRDLILVKPDPEPEKIGILFIPQGALPQGHQPGPWGECFLGTVVATGPGDKFIERGRKDGSVNRRLINADGSLRPLLTKVGDRVVFPRRPSAPGGDPDIIIDGEMYLIFHEEQFAYAVVKV